MEALESANKMQEYAQLGLDANHAQYGLDRSSRETRLDPRTKEYLQKGLKLCKLLQEGLPIDNKSVSASQLGSLFKIEPVKSKTRNIDIAEKLKSTARTLRLILDGGSGKRVKLQKIYEAIDVFELLNQWYTNTVFSELDSIRGRELK